MSLSTLDVSSKDFLNSWTLRQHYNKKMAIWELRAGEGQLKGFFVCVFQREGKRLWTAGPMMVEGEKLGTHIMDRQAHGW